MFPFYAKLKNSSIFWNGICTQNIFSLFERIPLKLKTIPSQLTYVARVKSTHFNEVEKRR